MPCEAPVMMATFRSLLMIPSLMSAACGIAAAPPVAWVMIWVGSGSGGTIGARQGVFPNPEEWRLSRLERDGLRGEPGEFGAQTWDREVQECPNLRRRHATLRHDEVGGHGRRFGIAKEEGQRSVLHALGNVIGVEAGHAAAGDGRCERRPDTVD